MDTTLYLVLAILLVTMGIVWGFVTLRQSKERHARASIHIPHPSTEVDPDDILSDAEFFAEPSSSALSDLGFNNMQDILPPPKSTANNFVKPAHPTQTKQSPANNLVALHIMAPAGNYFLGYELLQALLSAGLEHGSMNIFHRYDKSLGKDEVLFSLAQATEPGAFDLSKMGALACSGLSLFMVIKPHTTLAHLELMLATANQLAEDLGGQLEDMNHLPLTQQTINYYRKKITKH